MLRNNKYILPALWVLLLLSLFVAIVFGAVPISWNDMGNAIRHSLNGEPPENIHQGVFIQLRLPRVLLCGITGAVLAVSGVLMQGLFRNPLVEPGLTGTSAGAAFGASLIFVISAGFSPALKSITGPFLVPLFAFTGGLLTTFLVYLLAGNAKRVSVLSLLLTGIAVNALAMSGTGFMSYIARDPQARSITFWNMGSFAGASWFQVAITGTAALVIFSLSFRYAKSLNALLLGEDQAGLLGVDTRKLKRTLLILNTAMVATATAFTGVISFMGLIVPHLLRLLIGSDNKKLLPASMLLGAILLLWADTMARRLLAPAEIPIGIITSLAGAPVFILLLKRFTRGEQKGGFNA